MKKKFTQMFDDLDAGELSVLLEGTHADPIDRAAVGRIRAEVLADTSLSERAPKGRPWRALAAIAACCVLLFCLGFGTYAYAAEVREYNDAVRFFNDYELSTEGLTRGEIKAVYRDITTKSFTYSKTAEVIQKSLSSDPVGGYEILQDDPTPEDIENLWNYRNENGGYWFPIQNDTDGIRYDYRLVYRNDEALGYEVFDRSYLEKYDGETLLWSISVEEFGISGYSVVSDGVIAHGETITRSSEEVTHGWMAKIDQEGNLVWKHRLENGFEDESIAAVLENDDGSYAVISRGDYRYFCLSQYTQDGEVTHFQKTEVGNYGIWNAARFGDGYIVQLGSYITDEYARIVKVDHAGNITESISYGSEDAYYYITDMIEFDGNIYLSAYAVPRCDDEAQRFGGRHEIAPVLEYLFGNDILEISSEELTPMVRENYTAMLLVCDPNGGVPREFYAVKGSLGGKLALSDSGKLLWDVKSIATTFFSPVTSSFTIGGTCYVFRYTFDDNGKLISQEKTDEVTDYRR